jgi:hypothetical protein
MKITLISLTTKATIIDGYLFGIGLRIAIHTFLLGGIWLQGHTRFRWLEISKKTQSESNK